MSVCVMYILMGGGVFMTPGCVSDLGMIYPDEIVYTTHLPRTYSYVPTYRPTYQPRVIYRGYWHGYGRTYKPWQRRQKRNRFYTRSRSVKRFPVTKPKHNNVPKRNKKHFKKKK